jgi:hypothetical protein
MEQLLEQIQTNVMPVIKNAAAPLLDVINNFESLKAPLIWDIPNLPLYVVPVYVLFVFVGPKVIRSEVPGLNVPLMLWNLFLSVGSLAMFVPWAYEVCCVRESDVTLHCSFMYRVGGFFPVRERCLPIVLHAQR